MQATHRRRDAILRVASAVVAAALLAACQTQAVRPEPAPPEPFSLRILHINDHHSRVAPDSGQVLLLDGEPTQVSFGGFPQLVTAFGELARGADHVLKLHAGDAMTGDLYYTLFAGEADADLMNQVCFDAFTVGNHEFDGGDAGLKRFLDFLSKRTWDCGTPSLGANVRPTVGASPLAKFSERDYLLPRIVLERGGRRIGIVGIDVAGKTKASSSPDAGTTFLDEAATAQAELDALRADGVDIVVLMTHIGYQADVELAKTLRGVDVIVGGDSHSLLGDGFKEFGLTVEGPYPTRLRNPDGEPVCVVQAWQYTWVVGALDVDFDAKGRVTGCGGRPVLLLGDDLRRHGKPLEGADREAALARIDASPLLGRFEPAPAAEHVLDVYREQIEAFAGEQVATVPDRLCLRRVPGRHDRSRDGAPGCAAKTDAHGGWMQSLVAEVLLAQAERYGGADVALQNAGRAARGARGCDRLLPRGPERQHRRMALRGRAALGRGPDAQPRAGTDHAPGALDRHGLGAAGRRPQPPGRGQRLHRSRARRVRGPRRDPGEPPRGHLPGLCAGAGGLRARSRGAEAAAGGAAQHAAVPRRGRHGPPAALRRRPTPLGTRR